MSLPAFEPTFVLAILPEILLLALAIGTLALDMLLKNTRRTFMGWLTAIGLLSALVATLIFSQPSGEATLILGGMLRHDWLAYTFNVVLIFAAAITAIISVGIPEVAERGEYFALLIVAAMGMNLMAASADLMMLFLAIETTSIPLYILAGFLKSDDKSAESGLKYFLFGALTSAVMLYGFSLLYGLAGETNIYRLAQAMHLGELSPWLLGGTAALVLVGFAFKISAAPFHFWSPDVYEGAPTPITAFISTASKAAGFAVLVRFMLAVFPSIEFEWTWTLAVLATLTMTIGNVLALVQTNIKRLLAYSSIAHAGYALIGLVALSTQGAASLVFYIATYILTNLVAFSVVIVFTRAAGSEEIADYAGLSRKAPGLSLALLIAMLSLGGMPPLVGFVAKFYVFAAAVQSGWIWLAFVGVLNAIVGLYYYLTVLKVVYLYRSEGDEKPLAVPPSYAIVLGVCSLAIILIGSLSGPWIDWSLNVAANLF